MSTHDGPCDDGYGASRVLFEDVVAFLDGGVAAGLEHAELEDQLQQRSRQLLCRLFQDRLDRRAQREPRLAAVTDAVGVRRPSVEAGHHRGLATVFGEVDVERRAYARSRGSCGGRPSTLTSCTPPSTANLPTATCWCCRWTARTSSCGPTRCAPPPRRRPDKPPPSSRPVCPKANSPTANATVGAVYDLSPVPRQPTDVLASKGGDPPPAPNATAKWLTASVAESAAPLVGAVFDEAERRDPDHDRRWVALVDGNQHQIDCIHAQATQRNIDVAVVVDLIHVLEYLWGAAWCFYTEGDPAAEDWVQDRALAVLIVPPGEPHPNETTRPRRRAPGSLRFRGSRRR